MRPSRVDQPVKETSIVVDALNGRCAFHRDNGIDGKRREAGSLPIHNPVSLPAETPTEHVPLPPELRTENGVPARAEEREEAAEQGFSVDERKATGGNLFSGSELRVIPIARILPFKGQPRKWFDPKALDGLSRSMRSVGRIKAIQVRPLSPEERELHPGCDWELIDGERRVRSAKLAGMQVVEAIICEPGSREKQYLISAIANFGREDHTAHETMTAISEVMRLFSLSMQEVADMFGKSYGWVQQYMSLKNLHPKVWEAMSPELPEKQRLPFSTAKELVRYSEEAQLELLKDIREKKMRFMEAQLHIRKYAKAKGMTRGSRKAHPKEAFHVMKVSLDLWEERMTRYIEMSQPELRAVMRVASKDEFDRIFKKFEKCQALAAELLKRLKPLRK